MRVTFLRNSDNVDTLKNHLRISIIFYLGFTTPQLEGYIRSKGERNVLGQDWGRTPKSAPGVDSNSGPSAPLLMVTCLSRM